MEIKVLVLPSLGKTTLSCVTENKGEGVEMGGGDGGGKLTDVVLGVGKKIWYLLSFLAGQEEKKVRNHVPIQLPRCVFGWSKGNRKKKPSKGILFSLFTQRTNGVMERIHWETKDILPPMKSKCVSDRQQEDIFS